MQRLGLRKVGIHIAILEICALLSQIPWLCQIDLTQNPYPIGDFTVSALSARDVGLEETHVRMFKCNRHIGIVLLEKDVVAFERPPSGLRGRRHAFALSPRSSPSPSPPSPLTETGNLQCAAFRVQRGVVREVLARAGPAP